MGDSSKGKCLARFEISLKFGQVVRSHNRAQCQDIGRGVGDPGTTAASDPIPCRLDHFDGRRVVRAIRVGKFGYWNLQLRLQHYFAIVYLIHSSAGSAILVRRGCDREWLPIFIPPVSRVCSWGHETNPRWPMSSVTTKNVARK